MISLVFCCCYNTNKKNTNHDNLENYLKSEFNIHMDTLNTKLVLINYIGCKNCIDQSLKVFFNAGKDKKQYSFIIPGSKTQILNKYYKSAENRKNNNMSFLNKKLKIHIDSSNNIYEQNITVNGLSIYNIKNGSITGIKKISDLEKMNKNSVQEFWFKW